MRVLNCGCGGTPQGDVRLDAYRSSATNVLGDLRAGLPFRDGSFDEVLCTNVLEHMANPGALLSEIARVLMPGGKLRLRTDNASYWRFHIGARLGAGLGLAFAGIHSGRYEAAEARGPEDRHYSLFTLHHLRNHLRVAGLSPEWLDYWPKGVRPSRLVRFVPWTKPFLSAFINVEARKELALEPAHLQRT